MTRLVQLINETDRHSDNDGALFDAIAAGDQTPATPEQLRALAVALTREAIRTRLQLDAHETHLDDLRWREPLKSRAGRLLRLAAHRLDGAGS